VQTNGKPNETELQGRRELETSKHELIVRVRRRSGEKKKHVIQQSQAMERAHQTTDGRAEGKRLNN